MIVGLWTAHFVRICIANLLLFTSLYMLFPVLSFEMARRLGVSQAQTGGVFLLFTLGMFLIGAFYAYLVDAYKRKQICILAFALMTAATAGYTLAANCAELLLLGALQGVAFGVATTAGITLAIDMTCSAQRSAGNVNFAWVARIGMMLGIAVGVWLYRNHTFDTLVLCSVATGGVGILSLAGIYVPFRAPIVIRVYSFDRFFLLRGWLPALNLVLITFVPGLFIPIGHDLIDRPVWVLYGLPCGELHLPFFAGVAGGYLAALSLSWLPRLSLSFLPKEKTGWVVMSGLLLQLLAMVLLDAGCPPLAAALLLGAGLGVVMPEFLLLFIGLSHHCQRGTANTTQLLSCEVGFASGMAVSCTLPTAHLPLVGQGATLLGLLFFLVAAYPYYRRCKVR